MAQKLLKYSIGYNVNDNIRPLCKKFPQIIEYAKYFDSSMTMSFKVNDKMLLKSILKYGGK